MIKSSINADAGWMYEVSCCLDLGVSDAQIKTVIDLGAHPNYLQARAAQSAPKESNIFILLLSIILSFFHNMPLLSQHSS